MKKLKVLIVEDSKEDVLILLEYLQAARYSVEFEQVESRAEMENALAAGDWQLILSEYSLRSFDGLRALEVLKKSKLDIPFIMISGTLGEDAALQAMIAGVNDYFIKGKLNRLIPAIEREIHESENRNARRRAELDLEENKKRLQLALEAVGLGVWELNLKTEEIYWSPECFSILQVESIGTKLKDATSLILREDISRVLKTGSIAVEQQKNFAAEFRIIGIDGEIRWISAYGLAEYDENNTPFRVIGTIKDITESKRAEESLRESEATFRALVQASTQFIWVAKEDGSSETLFKRFSELSGREITDIEGMFSLIHPEDRESIIRFWNETRENGTFFNQVIRYLTKDSEYIYMATRVVPIYNEAGDFLRWIGVMNDVTERMNAEEAIRESAELNRAVLNSMLSNIAVLDRDGNVVAVNAAWRNLLDEKEGTEVFSNAEIGTNYLQLFENTSPAYAKETNVARKAVKSILNNKMRSFNFEYPFISKGITRHFLMNVTPLKTKQGGAVVSFTDITDRKIAEESLRRNEEQLRQSQKLESIGRLAGGIAHDFNNMLTAINGYSELTLRSLAKDDPLRRNLEEIKKAGERSAALTQQLLAFSRRQILQVKLIDVNQIISDSIVMLQRVIGEGIQIIPILDSALNSVKVDPGQISQMLLNLVVNARDAMPKGGTVTIRTKNKFLDEDFVSENSEARVGDYVMLAVSDTGKGIDEETQKQMFEPFFTTKDVGRGTGLGLSTIYGIVNQLKGFIRVESKIDVGSCFVIYLPADEEKIEPSAIHISDTDKTQGMETILLVEDEELVRKLSIKILEACGYSVLEARNGLEAMEICHNSTEKIDLVLSDVVMPLMGGRELAEKLAKTHPDIRVLLASGYIDDAVLQTEIEDSGMNFIQKPFTFGELARKVRQLLDDRKPLQK